jgi:hypothetical protein
MKKICALFGAAVLVLAANTTALGHDEDGVTEVDHYRDADVIHYDHHHRQIYTDEFGNVIGERTVHHDHHYVVPRYNHHRHHHPFFFNEW